MQPAGCSSTSTGVEQSAESRPAHSSPSSRCFASETAAESRRDKAFDAANLVFGPFDLTGTPSRFLWGERELVLSDPMMAWFVANYVPGMTDAERRQPDVSPLYADLRDMPPALFTCGTLDPLLDDTLFMEARWRSAANDTTLTLWPEAVHGFVAFDTEAAQRSRAEQYAFLHG